MMMKMRIYIGLCLFFVFFSLQGQDKEKLESDKKKIEQEIQQTSRLLNQTQKSKKNSLQELNLLNRNINKRAQLINGLEKEVKTVNTHIGKLSASVLRLDKDINTLKNEYAAMLRSTYYHRNQYSRMMFILASEDFNQAYRRLQYLRQYNDFQKQHIALIRAKQDALKNNMQSLEQQKQAKEKLRIEEQEARVQLQKEQKQKNTVLTSLKKQENKLKRDLAAQQKKVNQLNARIKKIIEEEIRRSNELARQKAEKEGKTTSTSTTTFALTPEQKVVSANFEGNKGRLPWPVERGSITSYFGTQPHPVLKGVSVSNNGIDILCPPGSVARAVFEGEVSNVVNLYNLKFVMVRHGAYTTVYSNLDDVYVKQGQKVKLKQNIGRVYTNQEEGKTELQFQIWKASSKLNPTQWITK